jgi:hypothetical protein
LFFLFVSKSVVNAGGPGSHSIRKLSLRAAVLPRKGGLFMWRLLCLLCVAAGIVAGTPVALSAVEVVYIEDFEDADGAPAFDALFSHDFSALDIHGDPADPNWLFDENARFSEMGVMLGLATNTQDAVQFRLSAGEAIVRASVDFYVWPYPSSLQQYHYIDFVGNNGQKRFYLAPASGFDTVTCMSEEVGSISQIKMCAIEGLFDNVTIHVVPEPSSVLPLCLVIGTWLSMSGWRRRTSGFA